MKRKPLDATHLVRATVAAERLQNVASPEDSLAAITEILSQLLGSEEFALLALNSS